MLKRAGRAPVLQRVVGAGLAGYLKFVRRTNRFVLDPPDLFDVIAPDLPAIVAMWHGQHFLMPFARLPEHRAKVMVSRSADGEINAIAAEKLGLGLIRASGAHQPHQIAKRGGARGFLEAMRALHAGYNIAMTADVPKVSRVAGPGIVQLAQRSGRPILPMSMATSRAIHLDSWDKATINLPFGRMALAAAPMIHVAPDLDADGLEAVRQDLERALHEVEARANATARAT